MTIIKKRNKNKPTVTNYVGNMSDLLQIIHDTKKVMIERHGHEEGLKAFEQLRAKDVLDHYAVDVSEDVVH